MLKWNTTTVDVPVSNKLFNYTQETLFNEKTEIHFGFKKGPLPVCGCDLPSPCADSGGGSF
jgi:hypothetical protein